MNKLTLYPERYSPTGNVTSEGVLNQLGRPKLDMLAVLVRESVQNSWDARDNSAAFIQYGIAGWTFSAQQRELLNKVVFPQCPPALGLKDVLSSTQDLQVLAIYDRGTEGLGGPTRADELPQDNESNNFVDFLRNVGQPPDKQLSGGTYGYGKAVFYRISAAHTILVHTHCLSHGKPQSRFMGAALGSPFTYKQHRFTGRHWWGRSEKDVIEPVLDEESDWLASSLGLPNFREQERGTTIVMIQPVWDDKKPEDAVQMMVEYLLWYFWPKMLEGDGGVPPIRFEASWQGQQIEIPHPTEFPPLEGFVQAMQRLKSSSPQQMTGLGEVYEVSTKQYSQYLGKLALERIPVKQRSVKVGQDTAPIPTVSHHVALMRQPELVVRYLEGPELPSTQIEYAGVFITDEAVDKVFANAEPPTHDDWVSNFLNERREKVYVNTALREIKNRLIEYVRPASTQAAPGELAPLGAFANQLGALLPGQTGNAAFSNLFARRRSIKGGYAGNAFETPVSNAPRTATGTTAPNLGQPLPSTEGLFDRSRIPSSNGSLGDNSDGFGRGIDAPVESGVVPSSSLPSESRENTTAENMPNVFDRSEAGTVGSSPNTETAAPSSSHRPGKARISRLEEGELVILDDGLPALRIEFELSFSGNPCTALVSALVGALLDGGEIETEPPEGSDVPHILYWENQQGQLYEGSAEITIRSSVGGIWFLIVSVPDDVMVGVELTAVVQMDKVE